MIEKVWILSLCYDQGCLTEKLMAFMSVLFFCSHHLSNSYYHLWNEEKQNNTLKNNKPQETQYAQKKTEEAKSV